MKKVLFSLQLLSTILYSSEQLIVDLDPRILVLKDGSAANVNFSCIHLEFNVTVERLYSNPPLVVRCAGKPCENISCTNQSIPVTVSVNATPSRSGIKADIIVMARYSSGESLNILETYNKITVLDTRSESLTLT